MMPLTLGVRRRNYLGWNWGTYIELSIDAIGHGVLKGREGPSICIPELANSDSESHQCQALEEYLERNTRVVTQLYKALTSKEAQPLHGLVAQDLEWWFHGPPHHRHHLVPWLTGSSLPSSKALVPEHVVGFGPVVIAEGFDEAHLVWWVHAWTVADDGLITQVKEYVNTSVTVQVLPNASNSKSQCIWQSRLCHESVPGLILAI
ncbi:hypothetical protein Fmac_014253 [Flemingia macrophylla]|uniref:Wound-induced protein 1 n=1 Tax=Flemingia macrophylla TaxID=520843 RepID=A0ABD1MB88_9FABA